MKPITPPSSTGLNLLGKLFGNPQTAVSSRSDRNRPVSGVNLTTISRDRSKNSAHNSSHCSTEHNEFAYLKSDVARKVFYEKRQLEVKYATLNDEHEKLKGKYERIKKEFVRLKEKYKDAKEAREIDNKSYRPTDDEEHFGWMEEGQKTQRSGVPAESNLIRLIMPQTLSTMSLPKTTLIPNTQIQIPIMQLSQLPPQSQPQIPESARSSASILDAQNTQLRQEMQGLKLQLQFALKEKARQQAKNKKMNELQIELNRKCEMLKADNQKLWRIKEIVKDVVLLDLTGLRREDTENPSEDKVDKKMKTSTS